MRWSLVLILLWTAMSGVAQELRVGVEPRVELMSIIFYLAGANEYSRPDVPGYKAAIERHFAEFRDHEVVRLARQLRATDGVSYDAVMSMALHIRDEKTLAERVPFDRPGINLDERWHGAKARAFLKSARQFVADAKFAEFLESQKPLYSVTDARLRSFMKENADIAWFSKFFGARPAVRFVVAPGLVNGGSSYGPRVMGEDGIEEVWAIGGVWKVDAEGLPEFTVNWNSTLVHEFVHSFANPLVDANAAGMDKAGEAILTRLQSEMKAQAYGSGRTVLRESLVRAASARYALEHGGEASARRAVQEERGRAFFWTHELLDLLGEYAKNREQYPTLGAFMPKVVGYFAGVPDRLEGLIRQYDEARPKVVSITIANGAQNVDPGLTAVIVRFDRPMLRERYAVAKTGTRPAPKFGKPSFDEAGTVFTLPVTLEPGKEYAFSLNWPGGGSFQSADGYLLKAMPVEFRTRAAE